MINFVKIPTMTVVKEKVNAKEHLFKVWYSALEAIQLNPSLTDLADVLEVKNTVIHVDYRFTLLLKKRKNATFLVLRKEMYMESSAYEYFFFPLTDAEATELQSIFDITVNIYETLKGSTYQEELLVS